MTKDQRPPFLNSQTLKVLVKPAGPHQRDRRSGWLIAAKTCSGVAGISRDVLKVLIGFSNSSRCRGPAVSLSGNHRRRVARAPAIGYGLKAMGHRRWVWVLAPGSCILAPVIWPLACSLRPLASYAHCLPSALSPPFARSAGVMTG